MADKSSAAKVSQTITWLIIGGIALMILWGLILSMLKAIGILLIMAMLVGVIVFYVRRYNRLREEHREYRRTHP